MRPIRFALLVAGTALYFATPAGAQDVRYEQTTTLALKGGSGSGYRLDEKTEVEIAFISERSTRNRAVSVLNASYAPLTSFHGWWNGERIAREFIQERTPQLADVFMSPGEVREMVAPETPKPGDVLSYRYERSFGDLGYAPVLTVPDLSRVEAFAVIVEHPVELVVSFDVFAPRGEVPYEVERERGKTTLRFGAIERAETLPLFGHQGYAAQVLVHARQGDEDVLPITPEAFAGWYRSLTAGARPDSLSPALVELAASLERDTDEATVAAIHDYVRGTVRYVADERAAGAIVPRAPDLVAQQGYGDCKDRAFLTAALARQLGLDVDVVLLSTTPVPEFDAAHVSLYNHVIAAWDRPDGETIYFDPTHRHVPFGALPESDVNARALRLTSEGAEPVILPTPATAPLFDVTIHADLEALDAAQAEVTVRGEFYGAVREAVDSGRGVDVENVLSALSALSLYKLRLQHFEPVEVAGDSARFTAVADLSELVVSSPTRRYLPKTPFRAVPAELAERADDPLPIWTDLRPDVRLVLDLDPGSLHAAPDSLALDGGNAATYHATLTPDGDRVRVVYRFRQSARRFDGADRDAYLHLGLAYLGARRDMFVLRPAELGTP